MDTKTLTTLKVKAKKSGRKNEKKKKNDTLDIDKRLEEVCKQTQKLATEDDDSGSSTDSEDLVNAINYNTITSLAALKDIIQGDSNDTPETDSFFQHYFMHHCNNLSSRNAIPNSPFPFAERRRLSQCREEDEDDERKENDPHPSVVSSEAGSEFESQASLATIAKDSSSSNDSEHNAPNSDKKEYIPQDETEGQEPSKRMVMGARHKFVVTASEPLPPQPLHCLAPVERALRSQVHNAHTVHFGTKGAEEQRPSLRSIFVGQNLHRDKNYFDSSLIEIRSTVDDGVPTSSEDIWVKRTDEKKVSNNFTSSNEQRDDDPQRRRSGTWGSQTPEIKPPAKKKPETKKKVVRRKSDVAKAQQRDRLDPAVAGSSQSVEERRRQVSKDGHAHTMYQQTIHGTSGVSRRPALFDIFKSKRVDAEKKPSIMQQVLAAVQNIGKPTSSPSKDATTVNSETETKEPEASSPNVPMEKVKDGSAHPHPKSDSMYYHTVASSQNRRPSGMFKLMDIFRSRTTSSNTPAEGPERRRARAIAQQQQLASANLRRAVSQDAERRRSSIGHLPTVRHRASDAFLDPHHAAMLFRDSRGLPATDPFLERVNYSELEEDESQIFVKFFKFHKCYDLIPTSAKLVIFDTKLLVKKAFFALVYNGVRAAPLWDSERQKYVGMLTITDFIKILQMYYTSPDVAMDELEEHRLETWQQVLKGSVMPLVSIDPEASLFEAIRILITNRIHRLPVIDPETGNVLYILTHKRILRFLFLYINELPKPKYLQCKLRELRIGTLSDIETATEDTSIIVALKKFVNRRVSALPLVDAEGRLKDIYAKFDVINLAAEKTYNNLEVTLKTANEHRNEWFEGVQKCTLDETLFSVMEKIVRAEVHRLVVVDNDDKVIGIISLSDLLMYLVLRPTGECSGGTSLRNEHGSIDEKDEYVDPSAAEKEETSRSGDLKDGDLVFSCDAEKEDDIVPSSDDL